LWGAVVVTAPIWRCAKGGQNGACACLVPGLGHPLSAVKSTEGYKIEQRGDMRVVMVVRSPRTSWPHVPTSSCDPTRRNLRDSGITPSNGPLVMASSEMMSASSFLFSPSASLSKVSLRVCRCGRRNLSGLGTLVIELWDERVDARVSLVTTNVSALRV
jgi:hypothetical protein